MKSFTGGDHLRNWLEQLVDGGYLPYGAELWTAAGARDEAAVAAALRRAVYDDPRPPVFALFCFILVALFGGDCDAVAADPTAEREFKAFRTELGHDAIYYNIITAYRVRARLSAFSAEQVAGMR